MTNPNVTLSRLTLLFVGIFLLVSVGILVAVIAVEMLFDLTFDNSAMGVIAPVVSAMQVGTIYFNRTGQRPAPSLSWRAGLAFSTVSLGLSIAVAVALYATGLLSEMAQIGSDRTLMLAIAGFLVFVWLIQILACRFCFAWGAKQGEKLQEKIAKRNASRG